MGTLTADCPRLDSHCPHKLATSCRLTSTPNCCACADERPHSRLYRVYIDGVGFVQRGTRWQSYCWFCKEFWNNRLAATDPPLEISQTQVPFIPDQTQFLERWFEFHQGYRVVRLADGSESRIAVIGEPFGEVSPGFLPRTLDQLRAGRDNDASRPENRFQRRRLSSEEARPEEPQQSIEDALDSLLQEISDDEEPPTQEQAPQEMPSRHPGLRRTEIHLQRARDRLVRVFGTREDVQRDDYESPLASMYNRAFARHQQAEDRRASGETTAPSTDNLSTQERREIEEQVLWGVINESRASLENDHQSNPSRTLTPPTTDRPREDSATASSPPPITQSAGVRAPLSLLERDISSAESSQEQLRASLEQITSDLSRFRELSVAAIALGEGGSNRGWSRSIANSLVHPDAPRPTLDAPDRPPPLSDEQMTKNLSCQVCYCQLADTAVLPCGHMVMCQWCADVVVPVKHSHVPVRPSKCPMCRKTVKQRFKIHVAG